MATEVIMPKLGQTMEHGLITEWLVQEGQTVRRGDPLFKIESDKAVLDANAPSSGVLRKILVPQGQTAPILSRVAVIAAADEDITAFLASGTPEPASAAAATTAVEQFTAAAPPAPVAEPETPSGERRFASPRARRLARLEGVDLQTISGSGPEGRIVERDVQAYLEKAPRATAGAKAAAAALGFDLTQAITPDAGQRLMQADVERMAGVAPAVAAGPAAPAPATPVERTPLAGVRALIAERMMGSVSSTAAYTLTVEADATALLKWRKSLAAATKEGERVPSFNDLLARLLVVALQEYPDLNAHLEGNEIVRTPSVNIGVAVDTGRGLVVPVLRDVHMMSVKEIAAGAAELVARARAGQLTPDDMSGGTFTISNLGMFDIDAFTPIINVPEVAILGVGRIAEKAVVRKGKVVARPMVVFSLTADHRLVDGAPGARFLQRFKLFGEPPLLALSHGAYWHRVGRDPRERGRAPSRLPEDDAYAFDGTLYRSQTSPLGRDSISSSLRARGPWLRWRNKASALSPPARYGDTTRPISSTKYSLRSAPAKPPPLSACTKLTPKRSTNSSRAARRSTRSLPVVIRWTPERSR